MHTETQNGKARDAGNPMHTQHSHTHTLALHQSRPGSLQLASESSATAAPQRPPLGAMTPDQARAYLSRRAAQGTHTPTDDAYAEDQQLEAELLDLLEQCMQSL